MKHFTLFILVMCCLFVAAQTQIGDDIDGEAPGDLFGRAVALSADGKRMAVGAPFNDGSGSEQGHVRVYREKAGVWTQIGNDIDGEGNGDRSGWSVSLSANGDRLAIGAILNDGSSINSGHVRIYEENNGTWTQIGQDIDGEGSLDRSGFSVSISTDGLRVAIGAIYNSGNGYNAGHVRIYEDSSGVWKQVGNAIEGELDGDECGRSVSLSAYGQRVAVGALYNDGNGLSSGHARVFEHINGVWTQVGNDIDGKDIKDESGWYVSLSANGRRVAVGSRYGDSPTEVDVGHVRVFEEAGGSWSQVGNDISGASASSAGVVSFAGNGKRLVVGAPFNSEAGSDAGKTSIYDEVGGTWLRSGSDLFGEASEDRSGWAVALSFNGERIAVGAIYNSANGMNAGHVRVFEQALVPVEEALIEQDLTITPNPTTGKITIELDIGKTMDASLVVLNIMGQRIHKEQLEISQQKLVKELDLGKLPNGTYLVQITNGNKSVTKRLIYLTE